MDTASCCRNIVGWFDGCGRGSSVGTGLSEQTTRDFHATWVDPTGGIWAVGGNVVSDPLDQGILAHYGASNLSTSVVNP